MAWAHGRRVAPHDVDLASATPSADGDRSWARYRVLWWSALLAVAVPGALVSSFVLPIPAVLIGVTVLGIRLGLSLVGVGGSCRRWAETAVAAVLLVASAPVLGVLTPPLMLLAVVTSVPVLRSFLPGSGARPVAGTGEPILPGETPVESCLGAMSGAELCDLWGRGFALLRTREDASRRVVGAGLRGSILDELERRDGTLLAAWLARHPSPASPPTWASVEEPPAPS